MWRATARGRSLDGELAGHAGLPVPRDGAVEAVRPGLELHLDRGRGAVLDHRALLVDAVAIHGDVVIRRLGVLQREGDLTRRRLGVGEAEGEALADGDVERAVARLSGPLRLGLAGLGERAAVVAGPRGGKGDVGGDVL